MKDPRSYGAADIVIVMFRFGFDLTVWIRTGDVTGTPWKDEWSTKEVLALVERDDVKAVAIDAIDEELEGCLLCRW